MTIAYKLFWNDTHRFTVYLRYRDENIPMVCYSDNTYEYHIPEIEERIARYFEVKGNEAIRCMRCAPHQTFEGRAKEYLLLQKAYDYRKEIAALFDHLSPARICYGSPVICVLETREEAKAFLLSEDYSKIRKQIFDILKPYDDYNALTLDDIRIFVDYREHMEGITMYGRWIDDFGIGEFEKYENSLINGE